MVVFLGTSWAVAVGRVASALHPRDPVAQDPAHGHGECAAGRSGRHPQNPDEPIGKEDDRALPGRSSGNPAPERIRGNAGISKVIRPRTLRERTSCPLYWLRGGPSRARRRLPDLRSRAAPLTAAPTPLVLSPIWSPVASGGSQMGEPRASE